MKKILALVLILMLLPVWALAETTFDGKVVAGESVSVTAPFGGTVSSFRLRAGSLISLGDQIATIETGRAIAHISWWPMGECRPRAGRRGLDGWSAYSEGRG